MINLDHVTTLATQIETSPAEDLKKILCHGRLIRLQSEKHTHFWNLSQKKIHQAFDRVFATGIERFASNPSVDFSHIGSKLQRDQTVGKTAAFALGGFAGWFVGFVYGNSMSNLILHEYGHAFVMKQIWKDAHPKVSANAKHWLELGEWQKWFSGERTGAPGNWTSRGYSLNATDFGRSLNPHEKELLVTFGGLGAELAANTAIAGLGLLAIRQKQRALGSFLVGTSLVSHLSAHSYIRRYPELLNEWKGTYGGDPPLIAEELSTLLGLSRVEAFRLLYYGYLFAPVALLATLSLIFMKTPQEIPDEMVLMRLLVEENPALALKKILAEVEIDVSSSISERDAEKLAFEISSRLTDKIKNNQEMLIVFEKTRKQIATDIKGKFGEAVTPFAFRLRGIASIAALVAEKMQALAQNTLPAFKEFIKFLVGIFMTAQAICLLIDGIQTDLDVGNKRLSNLAKALSVSRTALSLISLTAISTSLCVSGAASVVVPVLIFCTAFRVMLFSIHFWAGQSRFLNAG